MTDRLEARAVITADMSGFVRAANQAASATTALTNDLRGLNDALARMRTLNQRGGPLGGLVRSLQRLSDAAEQGNQAFDQVNQGLRQTADGADRLRESQGGLAQQNRNISRSNDTAATSYQRLARQLFDARVAIEDLEFAQRRGARTLGDMAQAQDIFEGRARSAVQIFNQLDDAQQSQVRTQLRLLEAQRTTNEARQSSRDLQREQIRETQRLAQVEQQLARDIARQQQQDFDEFARAEQQRRAELTDTAQQIARLQGQIGALNDLSAQGAQLTREQTQALRNQNADLAALQSAFGNLSQSEQTFVRQQIASAQAAERFTAAAQQSATARRELNTLNQQGNAGLVRTQAQFRDLARSLNDLTRAQEGFAQIQRDTGQLTSQQAAAQADVDAALRASTQAYESLNAAGRSRVDTLRQELSQTSATAAALREYQSSARAAEAAQRGLTENTFAWREALQDAAFALQSLSQTILTQVVQAVQVFREQEAAMAQFARITQESDAIVDAFTGRFRQLATEIPIATQELAQIAVLGGQIGLGVGALEDFTDTVARFSATTGVAADQASIFLARVLQLTNTDSSQISNLGAAVSALGSNSAATEQQILRVAEQISAVATQSNVSVQNVVGLSGALASLGIRPELARGALQRVLLSIGDAAESSGERTEQFATVIGDTSANIRNLQATDPQQVFFDFLAGLNQLSTGMGDTEEAGENLNQVLAELGFTSVQDRQLLIALGQNWGFVSDQLELANREFERNTFLMEESERLFGTVDASLTRVTNAWQNLGAAVVEAAGPFLKFFADVGTEILSFIAQNESLVAALSALGAAAAGVGGLAALGGAILAIRLGLSALVASLPQATGLLAALGTTGRVASVGVGLLSAAMRAVPVLALVAAVGIAINELSKLGETAVEANADAIAAAGGLDALTEAMISDTQAALSGNDALAFRVDRLGDLNAAERRAADETTDAAEATAALNRELGNTAGGAGQAASDLDRMGDSADGVVRAIGPAVQAWAEGVIEADLLASGVLESAESFEEFNSALEGVGGVSGVLEAELTEVGSGVDLVNQAIEDSIEQMGFWESVSLNAAEAFQDFTFGLVDLRPDSIQQMEQFAEVLEGVSEAQEQAARQQSIFGAETELTAEQIASAEGALIDLGNGTRIAGEAIVNATDDSALLDATLLGMTLTVNDVIDAFSSLIDPASIWTELTDEAAQAAEDAGDSFTRLGSDSLPEFNQRMSESEDLLLNNIDNLLQISERAGPDVAQALIEMGDAGVDLGFALAEALDEGQFDTFDEAVQSLGLDTQLAIQSITESFALISDASGQAGEDAREAFADLLDQDLDLPEFAAELENELADLDLETEVDLTSQIDNAQITEDLDVIAQILEQWALENGIEVDVDPEVDTSGISDDLGFLRQEFASLEGPSFALSLEVMDFTRQLQLAADRAGSTVSEAVAQDIEAAERAYNQGHLNFGEFMDSLQDIANANDIDITPLLEREDVIAELEALGIDLDAIAAEEDPRITPSVQGDEARSQLETLGLELDTQAGAVPPEFTPGVEGGSARSGMNLLSTDLDTEAESADLSFEPTTAEDAARRQMANLILTLIQIGSDTTIDMTPDIDPEPAKLAMDQLATALVEVGNNVVPEFVPQVNSGRARSDMTSLARGLVTAANRTTPTIVPRVAGGRARAQMNSLMGSLRAQASTVFVPVTPFLTNRVPRGNILAAADGGWVSGPGGPRADRIPALLSDGEFVINAAQARLWGPILEAINAGANNFALPQRLQNFQRREVEAVSNEGVFSAQGPVGPSSNRLRSLQSPAAVGPSTVINVNNTYPQAEPTSVTVNRGLQYAAMAMGPS